MARQIVAVRMSGGWTHRNIAGVGFIITDDPESYKAKTMKIQALIEEIATYNDFFTRDYTGDIARVEVITFEGDRYIRTRKDGVLTDDLLRLPRYESD